MPPILPIFALDTVLLPGQALPLHIFEPRYRQLLDDVRADAPRPPGHPGFGVLAAPHEWYFGTEASDVEGASSALAEVGTFADIISVEPYPDGRSDLLTVGSQRFRVLEIEPDAKPYLQAQVEWLPENLSEGDRKISVDLLAAARILCERYLTALGQLSGRDLSPRAFGADPIRLSYQITAELRVTNPERQKLLQAPTAEHRLRNAVSMLRREITLLASTRSVVVSPAVLRVDASAN